VVGGGAFGEGVVDVVEAEDELGQVDLVGYVQLLLLEALLEGQQQRLELVASVLLQLPALEDQQGEHSPG